MAANTETGINLKTLQRVDSNIIEIIDNASQVAIYKYERRLNKWEGTDIEGTLFLFKRSLYPFHGFIIVNRMSTTNFVETITCDMEFVQHEPYFLYKKSCGEIIGSWFYEKKDFRRITNKIQSIVLKQNSPRRRQRCLSDSDSQLKKDDVQDIMSMLSQAHTEYVKNEANVHIPPQNTNENIKNVSTCTNKKMNNKSVILSRDKSRSLCLRSSSEEKCAVSPRRRFLSTGSYDSTQSLPLSCNKVINELVFKSNNATAHSKDVNSQHFKDEFHGLNGVQLFPTNIENIDNLSAPTRLSPLFSQDEISSPTLSGISLLDQTPEAHKLTFKPWFPDFVPSNMMQMTFSSKANVTDNANNKAEYNTHSSNLKETLQSHIEWDSDIILKIHEAYIASLKSVFTTKKC